jgi:hypothetical protein
MKHLELQALQLKDLFAHFDLCDKVIVYVKDENVNLNTLINALTNIVSCGVNA